MFVVSDIDPAEQANFFRAQALKVRRLAGRINDERVASELFDYAAELEKQALRFGVLKS